MTIVDRKSRYGRNRRVHKVDMKHVAAATVAALDTNVVDDVRSITHDNGSEFQSDAKLQIGMGIPIYFADPSSPWQRGSIENSNGLIRQYVLNATTIDRPPFGLSVASRDPPPQAPRSDI